METATKINRMDFFIMKLMMSKNCTDEFNSLTLPEIKNEIGNICYQTVRNSVLRLMKIGYAEQGAFVAQAKSYYITEQGISFMKERTQK